MKIYSFSPHTFPMDEIEIFKKWKIALHQKSKVSAFPAKVFSIRKEDSKSEYFYFGFVFVLCIGSSKTNDIVDAAEKKAYNSIASKIERDIRRSGLRDELILRQLKPKKIKK